MSTLDEARSLELAQQINSKARKPFDNAYRAALKLKGAHYVQGFLATVGQPYKPIEHAWVELEATILDPTLPHLNRKADRLYYFPAQRLTLKELKAILEESKEDYPEDDPLPIYGEAPYAYYGDVMLGGPEYLVAHEAAGLKCQELNQRNAEQN